MEFKEFQELLAEVAKTYSSQKEFAEALGIDPSRLSKAINVGEFAFNPENCLRLAKLSGKPPSAILRAAGKADIAELIESLYGKQRTDLLTDEEREVLDIFNALSPARRASWRTLLKQEAPRKRGAAGRFRRAQASDKKTPRPGQGSAPR